jgi:hypothetical protein
MTNRTARLPALVLLAVLAGCLETPPKAGPKPPPPVPSPAAIDQRQRDLEYRIEQGVRTGHITRDEHLLLRNQADDVRREERHS